MTRFRVTTKFFREEMFWDWQGIKPILELFSDIFGRDYFIFVNIQNRYVYLPEKWFSL